MSSDGLLDLPHDIDDRITDLCESNENLTPDAVIRDLVRIACIANLAKQGELDGSKLVLAGGMAMRCLRSHRMSIYDADMSGSKALNADDLETSISLDDDDVVLQARKGPPGKKLQTFKPIEYEAYFSRLNGASGDFKIDVSFRGIELEPAIVPLNHGYEFGLLADPDLQVPILNPLEILAEKTIAWILYGHAKHYFDMAHLVKLLNLNEGLNDPQTQGMLRRLFKIKLNSNRGLSSKIDVRVESLNIQIVEKRLTDPQDEMEPGHTPETLAYIKGIPPRLSVARDAITSVIVPILAADADLLN